jgi:hypothetical protein
MLYRFREQQAVDMGMGQRTKGDRRPRMASAVSSLRDCERWRGDILRDVSRKVSKIQDGESKYLFDKPCGADQAVASFLLTFTLSLGIA